MALSMPTTVAVNNTFMSYNKPSLGSTGLVGVLVTFYIIVAICAIGSNATILIAIIRRLVPRNTVNVFFSSLAVSDLLMTFLSSLDCFAYLNGSWPFGQSICKIQSLLLEVSFAASTLTLVAVSCERYLLICHPRIKRRTVRTIYFVLAGVWTGSFIITSPLIHGYIVYEEINKQKKTRELVCANKGISAQYIMVYYLTYSIVTYVIPLIIMALTHWRISQSVRDNDRRQKFAQTRASDEKIQITNIATIQQQQVLQQQQQLQQQQEGSSTTPGGSDERLNADVSSDENSDPKTTPRSIRNTLIGPILQLKIKSSSAEREKKRNDRRIKAVRMLFVVTVVFFLLWTPFIIMRVVVLAGKHISTYAYKFSEILIFSSTAVNGFIYAYMSPPFRRAFKAILCCQHKSDIIQRYAQNTLSNSEETSRRLNVTNLSSPNPGSITRIVSLK